MNALRYTRFMKQDFKTNSDRIADGEYCVRCEGPIDDRAVETPNGEAMCLDCYSSYCDHVYETNREEM